jgi:competence protein ComEC
MKIEKVSFFSKRKDFFVFLLFCLFILLYSLLIEYQSFKQLTRFDTAIVDATVIKQYEKSKDSRTYQVLKLKSKQGFTFYTTAKKTLHNIQNKKARLEIYTSHITFSNFFTYFYAYSKILNISKNISIKEKLNKNIYETHSDKNISNLYQALYTATPIDKDLQTVFSSLGVSHLLAISGFHLGVLSGLLLLLFKYPYQILQNRYFPYRNSKVDIFIAIVGVLFTYLIFLDSPPSLVRAFFMLIIGFILYDRGIKIISMQTLFLTIIILISFFPRLVFSLGFWLSVSGVFYIFLALIYFKNLAKYHYTYMDIFNDAPIFISYIWKF